MLILLPPSEGKTAPTTGPPVDLEALAYAAELTESRQKLLEALAALAELPLERAVSMLAVSTGQAGEVAVDAELISAPAGPAAGVYTGVLYDRLRLPELPKRAQGQVLIASALWGVLRPADRIPYYRFSAKAKLDGIGGLAAFWRPALTAALPDEEGALVVDMRSGAYAAAWKPKRASSSPCAPSARRRASANRCPTWRRRCAAKSPARCSRQRSRPRTPRPPRDSPPRRASPSSSAPATWT